MTADPQIGPAEPGRRTSGGSRGRRHSRTVVIGRGLTDDQALVEVGACLASLSSMECQEALSYACARYVSETADPAVAITELLRRAGADLDRARTIHAERGEGFLIR